MSSMGDWLFLIIGIAVVALVAFVGLVASRRAAASPRSPTRGTDIIAPPAAAGPEDVEVREPTAPARIPEPEAPALERPESTASRLVRLRQRLSRSQGVLGRGLLVLLSRDRLDDDTWDDIEDTLITADMGVAPTQELVEKLRIRLRVQGADAASRPRRTP